MCGGRGGRLCDDDASIAWLGHGADGGAPRIGRRCGFPARNGAGGDFAIDTWDHRAISKFANIAEPRRRRATMDNPTPEARARSRTSASESVRARSRRDGEIVLL